MRRVAAWVAWGCLATAVAGCAGGISPQVHEEATPLSGFAELRGDPAAFAGKTVVLGGEIIETRNREDGTTLLVLERPLSASRRPQRRDMSGGRFMIRFKDYLDPVLFAPGRLLTAAGRVSAPVSEPVGEAPYSYVVLEGREIHLWDDYEDTGYPYWFDRAPWYPWWYDPYWGRRRPW